MDLPRELIAADSLFVTFINLVALSAVLICVFQFLRTERDLAAEVLRRYDEVAKARSELAREEAASSAKSTFLANISHELRTPLGAILGYSELLQDSDISPEERLQFTETIHRNGQTLARLVNDILDLSKIEAGKIEVEKIVVDPQVIVMDVVSLFSISAQKKGLEIRVHQLEALPKNIVSDPLRFQQILNNIIGNAIKFTEKGAIEIRASCSEQNLSIEVADSGRGLTPEEQQRLFKPFSQAASDIARIYGGTGLGLNLSRSLAKLLGGDLKLAWSQAGEGSAFVFVHPLNTQKV
jgi:signal transduction histidine kinase